MLLPSELYPFTVTRGDFLHKVGDEAEWTGLHSPVDDRKDNYYGMRSDHGETLTQKHYEHGRTCHAKLILKAPTIKTEDDQPTVEAACVGIGNPNLTTYAHCTDKAKAIEHAKTPPLALPGTAITALDPRTPSEKGPPGREKRARTHGYGPGVRVWAFRSTAAIVVGQTSASPGPV